MSDRSKDGSAQAERDLAQARDSPKRDRHEGVCFASHPAAEKTVMALHH